MPPRVLPCFWCPARPGVWIFHPPAPWPGAPLRWTPSSRPEDHPRRSCAMLIHAAEPLFAWGRLEARPTLPTSRDCPNPLPDQPLLAGLRAARGHGRDDYPVERLWSVVVLTIALRHHSLND